MSKKEVAIGLLITCLLVILAVQFASAYPDGLEWTANALGFVHKETSFNVNIMPDYEISFIPFKSLSGSLAGIIGAASVFLLSILVSKIMVKNK